jgi:hypothetical protein
MKIKNFNQKSSEYRLFERLKTNFSSVVGHDPGHQFFVLVFRFFWGVNGSFPLIFRFLLY